jgi:hypothetical protein
MAKRPRKGKQAGPRVRPDSRAGEALYLMVLSLAVIACFWPLTQYFLAQDDFILIENAWNDGRGAFFDFFQRGPGQFRPLTKALYFSLTYPVFGLNGLAYHLVSLAVYVLNVWLLFLLLRRLRIQTPAALATTTLFAMSVAYFDIIAWASCIQQLLGQALSLASLIFGVDALATRRVRARLFSLIAYAGALLCFEQTFGIPLLLLLVALFRLEGSGPRRSIDCTLRVLAPHLALIVIYVTFMTLWKGLPSDGSYAFALGRNVAVNLTTYLGWVTDFGADFPSVTTGETIRLVPGHAILALLVAYTVARRRFRELLFGLSYYLLCLSPTLFLREHTYYLHTYVPAFGFAYLIALFFNDVFRIRAVGKKAAWAGVFAVLVIMSVVSFTMVRKNERDKMLDDPVLKESFVLRRAETAENAYRSMMTSGTRFGEVGSVYLVYGRPGGKDMFNVQNVVVALGYGSAIRLFYEKKNLDVRFGLIDEPIEADSKKPIHFYYFDDVGNCFPTDDPILREQVREDP